MDDPKPTPCNRCGMPIYFLKLGLGSWKVCDDPDFTKIHKHKKPKPSKAELEAQKQRAKELNELFG